MAYYSLDYDLFLHATKSFCHCCGSLENLVDAHIVTKNNDVFLRKFCPQCGESYLKISTDKEYFHRCESYLKKPDLPECFTSKIKKGCPFDCGVCPQHQNHPCLALFNITHECNMKCPVCYYDAEPHLGHFRSLEEIQQMLDTLLRVESSPDLIQVTGGEPTLHPEIIPILRLLKNSPVRHLMLNTNGIRIAEDETFVQELKRLENRFEVYLQFDSLQEESLVRLRGRDMRATRLKALNKLESYGISTTLVCTVAKGINESEISDIIAFALQYRCVRGVVFQPIQTAGRMTLEDDYRITLSELRKIIIDDQKNPFTHDDMIPLPCDPHKICVGYAAKHIDSDKNVRVYPVTGKIPKSMITEHTGTIAFEQDKGFIQTVIETISLDTAMGEHILKDRIKQKLFCCWPSFLTPQSMTYDNVFRIVIMEFSDIYNFDISNIKRECNFMVEPSRVIPFSTFNMFQMK